MRKNRILIATLLILTGVLILFNFPSIYTSQDLEIEKRNIKINETSFTVEIVDTPNLRHRGLSGRESLAEKSGMLFVFQEPNIYQFWMLDMIIPIDIIWFDEDMRISHIEKNIPPDSFPKTFKSDKKGRYVLEINALESDKYSLELGDRLILNDTVE